MPGLRRASDGKMGILQDVWTEIRLERYGMSRLIDAQPTVWDPEKVVEQLEKFREEMERWDTN